MANPRDNRKQENFDLIQDIMNDKVKLAIAIGILILIIVVVYMLLTHKKPFGGAGMMELFSETSPMAPLTNTPSM